MLRLDPTRENRKVLADLRIGLTPKERWIMIATAFCNPHIRRQYSLFDSPQTLDEHAKSPLLYPHNTGQQSCGEAAELCGQSTVLTNKDKILKKFGIGENWGLGIRKNRKYKRVRFGSFKNILTP